MITHSRPIRAQFRYTPTTEVEARRQQQEREARRLALIQAIGEIASQVRERVRGELGADLEEVLLAIRGRLRRRETGV